VIRYALAAALVAIIALGGALWWQAGESAALEEENARLERSLLSYKAQAEQTREALAVARAAQKRAAARAAEYDAIREAVLRGDYEDVPLPDWFLDLLRDLGLRPGD
jgi:hypothetical protein